VRRSFLILVSAVVLAPAGPIVAGAAATPTPRASLPDIEDEVMCTICGTLLEESQSPQADRERALIRKLIAEGKTKDQIKDALVAEYGPRVLAMPSTHGFDLLAWLVPGLGIVLAAAAIAYGLRRTLRDRARRVAEPEPLDPIDAARLESDMRQTEL
jgi:cytochrome c-type biogenesis protein CcmH